ncbi:MAG: (2Fe-2S)-binding protein [Actinobacteria bacterium]|nr:(2Fe-2S)-binding protein [Actinomycetota bacterium]
MRVNDREPIDEGLLPADLRLLDYLRDQCGLVGTKESCGRGECGACTVLVDGEAILSCITLASRVQGHVETIEGVAEESAELRESFARHGAFQCGFCTPGQIVRATAILRGGCPDTDVELRKAMNGNVCRCTGYNGIIAAIREVAE